MEQIYDREERKRERQRFREQIGEILTQDQKDKFSMCKSYRPRSKRGPLPLAE